ncbi:hypothetical protein ACFL2V_15195 [Pseudomonadota bacterium]
MTEDLFPEKDQSSPLNMPEEEQSHIRNTEVAEVIHIDDIRERVVQRAVGVYLSSKEARIIKREIMRRIAQFPEGLLIKRGDELDLEVIKERAVRLSLEVDDRFNDQQIRELVALIDKMGAESIGRLAS